jgi:hypothetical protein
MLYYKVNSVSSKKIFVSSSPFTGELKKANDESYPWKIILRFQQRKYFDDFCKSIEVNINVPSNSKSNWNDVLKKFDWCDMPEYDYTTPDEFSVDINLMYKLEDKEEVLKIIPQDRVFKIKTPNYLIRNGLYKGQYKYTITYEIPDVPEWRRNLLKSEYKCEEIKVKYPIYVISLSRYDEKQHLTISWLEDSKLPYYVVVEPFEEEKYKESLEKMKKKNGVVYGKILVGERDYHKDGNGGIPVRNFVYSHSKNVIGSKRHWILDDNIKEYERRNKFIKKTIYGGATFRVIEDYVDRYKNVAVAGHDYSSFSPPTSNAVPIAYTKAFSSILISNEFKDMEVEPCKIWRGKYNEDLDLSIREWIAGRPVMLFRNITCNKLKTGVVKGGNQVDIYKDKDWSYNKAIEIVKRYENLDKDLEVKMIENVIGRAYHHSVKFLISREPILKQEFSQYKNRAEGVNNYGMELVK